MPAKVVTTPAGVSLRIHEHQGGSPVDVVVAEDRDCLPLLNRCEESFGGQAEIPKDGNGISPHWGFREKCVNQTVRGTPPGLGYRYRNVLRCRLLEACGVVNDAEGLGGSWH